MVWSSGRDLVIHFYLKVPVGWGWGCVAFPKIDSPLYIYHSFVWPNFNFLHDSHCITFFTQPCLVLYSIFYYLLSRVCFFLDKRQLIVFHLILSDSKSPQVSRILLSILAVLNNAVVWMVFTCPATSKSSRAFNNPLVTVPKAPITIAIIGNFMFHSFFISLARSRNLSIFSHSFSFLLWSAGTVLFL